MVECEICGKETDNPKEFDGKMLCLNCYVEKEERGYSGGCRCGCLCK